MADAIAYKVLTADEMTALERDGAFTGSAADRADGFIHLSTSEQLEGTIAKHFGGQEELQLAAVDLEALGDAVRWEPSRGGALFPHVYAALTLDVIVAYSPLEREPDGSIRLPVAG